MPAATDSKFLAERIIARLPPQRRSNLERRIKEHLGRYTLSEPDADGYSVRREDMPHANRIYNMLGRLSALANR